MVAINYTSIHPFASIASRSASEESATPPSSCTESSIALWKRSLLTSPKVKGSSSRVKSLSQLSGGAKFDFVRDLLVLRKPSAQTPTNAVCIFLIPTALNLNLLT